MKGVRFLFLLACIISCSVGCAKKNNVPWAPHNEFSEHSVPGKVWDPKYYVYNNGKYSFRKGKYRRLLSKKGYYKSSLEGYTYKSDKADSKPK
jgi:hypothetical protein